MKRKIYGIVIVMFCAALLTGCGGKQPHGPERKQAGETDTAEADDVALTPIADVRSALEDDIQALRDGKYKNLVPDDAMSFYFPETMTEVYELSLEESREITVDEAQPFFSELFDFLLPGRLTEEEKAYEFRVACNEDFHEDKYPYSCPTVQEYIQNVEGKRNGEDDFWILMTDTPEWYLAVTLSGEFLGYRDGVAEKYNGYPVNISGKYFLTDNNPVYKYYGLPDLGSEDTYQLLDGEMSVRDAVASTEAFLNDIASRGLCCADGKAFPVRVMGCLVVDMGDGHYGYSMRVMPEYKGVIFGANPMKTGDFALHTIPVSEDSYDNYPGIAYMVQTDKVNGAQDPFMCTNGDVKEVDCSDRILPLADAAKILSEKLTGHVAFGVESIAFVYESKSVKERPTARSIRPCWSFQVRDKVNGSLQFMYVDALNGNCVHMYTQRPEDSLWEEG